MAPGMQCEGELPGQLLDAADVRVVGAWCQEHTHGSHSYRTRDALARPLHDPLVQVTTELAERQKRGHL